MIAEWIKDLRSGKFHQGYGGLNRYNNEYCCLGVMCETYKRLTGKGEWVVSTNPDDDGQKIFIIYDLDDSMVIDKSTPSFPPKVVSMFFGMLSPDPSVKVSGPLMINGSPIPNGGSIGLAQLNDAYKFDFRQIADAIEDTYVKK